MGVGGSGLTDGLPLPLPRDVMIVVFRYCSIKDALSARLVCRGWSDVERDKWVWVGEAVRRYKESLPLVHPDHVKGLLYMSGGWVGAVSVATAIFATAATLPLPVFIPVWVFFDTNDTVKYTIADSFIKSYQVHNTGRLLWESEHPPLPSSHFVEKANVIYPD